MTLTKKPLGPESPKIRPDNDAVSLHTQPSSSSSGSASAATPSSSGADDSAIQSRQYLDDDDDAPELAVDDLPPLYSDVIADDSLNGSSAPLLGHNGNDNNNSNSNSNRRIPFGAVNPSTGEVCDPFRDHKGEAVRELVGGPVTCDAELLLRHVNGWATMPPRPYVRLLGTHTATVENSQGKKESRTITDFDVRVEMTPYLFADAARHRSWRQVRTPDNFAKTHRGTVFACRAPTAVANAATDPDPSYSPTLQDWCEDFVNRKSMLKIFTLKRRMTGFNEPKVRRYLENLVQSTNYRGHVAVSFPTDEEQLDIYNDHWINQWRVLRWVRVIFVLSLLFLLTWPFLFFTTKRYEVVTVDWPFGRVLGSNPRESDQYEYISLSEDQWYNMWGRALYNAVLAKRQCVLDQNDLRVSGGSEPSFQDVSTGNATIDTTLNFVQASISAMGQVNRQLGWGGDC